MKSNARLLSLFSVLIFLAAIFVSGCATTDTAGRSAAAGGMFGTLLGAAVGAAIGAAVGHPGIGAAIGAGAGALAGTTAGYAAGQREKTMRAQGYQPPSIPDYIQSIGPPWWNGNVWMLKGNQGNSMWWNESEERWQY